MAKRLNLENLCCIFPKNGYRLLSVSGFDTSPVPPPRGIPPSAALASSESSTVTARSEFYVPTQKQPQQRYQQHSHSHQQHPHQHQQQQQHLPKNNSNVPCSTAAVFNTLLSLQNNNNKPANFEDIHEQFRQIVMKDVMAYQAQREIKRRPLIEL